MMKILCITSIFPNRLRPNKGIYNWRHFAQLQERAEVRVISPIPWTDDLRALRRGLGRLASSAWTEWEGVSVSYPRFYYTPGLGRAAYGSLLKASIRQSVRNEIADFGPELIYACWAYPDGWAACRLAKEYGLPAVVKVHGSDLLTLDDQPAKKHRTIEMVREVDAISAVSEDLRQTAVKLGAAEDRAHLIYEGTDRERFCPGDRQTSRRTLGLAPEGLRVLFVGNLVPVKAVHILIDACARLLAGGLQFEADIVGEGPLREELEQQIDRLGLTDRVHLRGRKLQADLPNWYRASDLVVLSSHSEGVPNVLVEAAACGIPFVATNVGGISEIAHLSPGTLIDPNDPAALARGIELKLRNVPECAAQINSDRIPSVAECANETLELFSQLLVEREPLDCRMENVSCRALANP